MKKKLLLIMLALTMVVSGAALTGCGGGEEAASSGSSGSAAPAATDGALVYASGDYTAINPALYEHGEINALLFAGLTAHNEKNEVVPGLAKEWEKSEDGKEYTFKLRDGLTFHDGKPLTSEDVKFTLEAITDEKNQSEIVSNYTDIDKIQCPDEKTVKITLKDNNEAFPDYMTIGILPKHLLEGKNLAEDGFNQNPVGAGPYKLTAWDEGQSITMEKFDGYYAGAPKIEKVIFKIVADSDARALALESGDVDMAQVTPSAAKDFKDKDGFNVYDMKTADYRAIAYNFNNKFWQDHRELPNILSYAVDRESIVKGVLQGDGEVAFSPLQAGEYVNEDMEKFSYDPDKAQKLLEEAGWKKNSDGIYEKDGKTLSFTIYAMEDDQVRVDMAKVCAKNLKDIGVDAKAEAKAELDWENQDACIIGWGSPFDPDDHTYKIFTSEAGDNYTYYSNKKVDEILTEARAESDKDARKKLYADFQEEMAKDMPYTFLAYVDANYVIKDGIKGITEDTILGHHGVGVFWNIAEWTME
ncbi:MAG: ABC transporter substrate-binding protein [Firmicutes bacterium]|nr:ABC transporter substrate-binding protein [Bacillota bacterium]